MKLYSLKQVFKRCIVLNALFCAFLICFIMLVLRNNLENSQDPLPLLFFIGAAVVFVACAGGLSYRFADGKRFMPVGRFVIFLGKILLLVLFEAAMIIFHNYIVLGCIAAGLSALFITLIWLLYRKYLKTEPPIMLFLTSDL